MFYEHNHISDGGYYPKCPRCILNFSAPELLLSFHRVLDLLYQFAPMNVGEYETVKNAISIIKKAEGRE